MPRAAFFVSRYERPKILISVAVLIGVLALSLLSLAAFVSFAWPEHGPPPPPPAAHAGHVGDFVVGQPVAFALARAYLVKQPDGGFLALSWRSTYRGCTVIWRPDFGFTDPRDGVYKLGWFRDPCHGAIWDVNGVLVAGPAARNLDRFPVEVSANDVYVHGDSLHLIPGATPSTIIYR